MAIVFFEGFNFYNNHTAKLNSTYWTASAGYGFDSGRTGAAIYLPSRASAAPVTDTSTLTLANFTDPLSVGGGSNTCIGLGFWIGTGGLISSDVRYYAAPYTEKLLSLTTSNGTLNIDVQRPTDGYGVLLVVRENDTPINTYDFRSATGNSWNHSTFNGWASTVTDAMYLDFFFNAASGVFSVRAAGGNTLSTPLTNASGSATTAITSFSSITAVTFYGGQAFSGYGGDMGQRKYDDFYFAAGNSVSDVFLGPNTRIYRVEVSDTVSSTWQTDLAAHNPQYSLQTNEGDSAYMRSGFTNDALLLHLYDLPGDAPAYVNGVKFFNVVRKAGLDDRHIVNLMAANSGASAQEIGPTYAITSESYSLKESVFLTNPLTSSNWTISDINNMVIGVKNVS